MISITVITISRSTGKTSWRLSAIRNSTGLAFSDCGLTDIAMKRLASVALIIYKLISIITRKALASGWICLATRNTTKYARTSNKRIIPFCLSEITRWASSCTIKHILTIITILNASISHKIVSTCESGMSIIRTLKRSIECTKDWVSELARTSGTLLSCWIKIESIWASIAFNSRSCRSTTYTSNWSLLSDICTNMASRTYKYRCARTRSTWTCRACITICCAWRTQNSVKSISSRASRTCWGIRACWASTWTSLT